MDTTYIKMADCPEIQDLWKPQCGDRYAIWDGTWQDYVFVGDGDLIKLDKTGKVWLPRQDQLQEMLGNMEKTLPLFYHWGRTLEPFIAYADSWEQLWLGLVMKENFGKVRTGQEWKEGE